MFICKEHGETETAKCHKCVDEDEPNPFDGFKFIHIETPEGFVCCDLCNKDYSDDKTEGGYIFSSKAVCPDCASEFRKGAEKYNETKYIVKEAKDGQSFRDMVIEFREATK